MTEAGIQVREVYKVFGGRASLPRALAMLRAGASKQEVQAKLGCHVGLAGVDMALPAGRISCIMGLSGSGKSTLVRHLNRLIDPSAGKILVGSQDILQLDAAGLRHLRRHIISMVFQGFGLLPHLDVLENVAFGLRARGDSAGRALRAAQDWIERVGLEGYARSYPDELSGGMRQRVGLARALAMDSPIVLMDEPFSALDPLIRRDLQEQLQALQRSLRKTIVFVTHDLDEALRLGQHIIILRDGRVEQAGTPDDIRDRPASPHVAEFIRRGEPAGGPPTDS
ncbi:ATP-binding cassette domain-containing protein [Candidimonas nitroreducens]|uniref:ABC transporter ATP-binding protein n=1 Tax=Candidimonas nitroreducens TaxID=683354 RepID=A0A225MUJ8_9BURK|nr:ATP-binding cassette domain-containing protein [Candidimonas nitroreducens]OWT64143.1 ABC transporter ATP-binding protein [Candidimonas nitroreducens]